MSEIQKPNVLLGLVEILRELENVTIESDEPASDKMEKTRRVLDRLYGILNVLDAKANGLLTLNGILIAGIIVMKSNLSEASRGFFPGGAICLYSAVLTAAFIALLFSLVSCLRVVCIKWGFFEKARSSEEKFEAELASLTGEIESRTKTFQCAWWVTSLSGGTVIFFVVLSQIFAMVFPS